MQKSFFDVSGHCSFPNKINYFPVSVITAPRMCFVLLTLAFPQTVVTTPGAPTRGLELERGGGFSFLSPVVGVDVIRALQPGRATPKSRAAGFPGPHRSGSWHLVLDSWALHVLPAVHSTVFRARRSCREERCAEMFKCLSYQISQ